MSKNVLNILLENPQDVFKLFTNDSENSNYFNDLIKNILNPISKDYSVLDEIYTDGLDSSQIYGQAKIVINGVGESLLMDKIPELKDKFGISPVTDDSREDEDDDISDEDNELDTEGNFTGFENTTENLEDGEALTAEEDSESEEKEDEDEEEKDEDEEEEEDQDDGIKEKDEEPIAESHHTINKDVHGLNDEFFDIDEFNRQTLSLENGENDIEEGEEIDYFGSLSDGDEEEDEMDYFEDFYNKPELRNTMKNTASTLNDQVDGSVDEENGEFDDDEYEKAVGSAMLDLFADEEEESPKEAKNLSSYEKHQQELQEEIARLEAELVADKKWTMKGEISSKDRPEDSLLDDPESHSLQFDRTAKAVPVITQEVTETLEDLIKRRIREEKFDEVPKRVITDVSRFHNKQKYELSEEKSQKSLAELYEDDYNKEDQSQEVNEELKKQHDEISDLFTKVTHKLDSLCSAHFIPKPHQFKTIDIKVSDNAASISMEDAQPLHVSSEAALAPQEVYKIGNDKPQANGVQGKSEVLLKSGLSYSKDELSREDKQRLRRANKRKKAKHYNERKEYESQVDKQSGSTSNKRQKVGDVINTLSKAKNISVIGSKGEVRDVKGNIKKSQGARGSSSFKL